MRHPSCPSSWSLLKGAGHGAQIWWWNDGGRGGPHGRSPRQRKVRTRVLREDRQEGRLQHRDQVRSRVLRTHRQEGRQGRDREVRPRPLRADRSQGRTEGRGPHRAREGSRGRASAPGRARVRRRAGRRRGRRLAHRPRLAAMGKDVRIGTRVVRSARALPPGEGVPVAPPLVQSVAFDYRSAAALEVALAELEGTAAATCFVSGMAAIAAFVDACAVATGGRVVAQEDIYGQVRALFERWIRERGAKIIFVDATDHRKVEAALREAPTTLLYIEAMANPLLRITDIAALAKLAHENGATL